MRSAVPAGTGMKRTTRAVALAVAALALAAACTQDQAAGEGSHQGRDPPRAAYTFFRATRPGYDGSGLAVLLQGPDFTVLVDTGFPLDQERATELVPLLGQRGVERLDLLVGTHPHGDHVGQHPEVLAAVDADQLWMAGHDLSMQRDSTWHAEALAAARRAIDRSQAEYLEPRRGHTEKVGSLTLEILHPVELMAGHADPWEVNQDSLVIRATYGDVRLLLTGDAGHLAEGLMLGGGVDLAADILQLGHHGVEDSSSRAFLDAVSPDHAIWSADHAHVPDPAVVETVLRTGATLWGTSAHGHVTVTTDGLEIEVVTDTGAAGFRTLAAWERWQLETYGE